MLGCVINDFIFQNLKLFMFLTFQVWSRRRNKIKWSNFNFIWLLKVLVFRQVSQVCLFTCISLLSIKISHISISELSKRRREWFDYFLLREISAWSLSPTVVSVPNSHKNLINSPFTLSADYKSGAVNKVVVSDQHQIHLTTNVSLLW